MLDGTGRSAGRCYLGQMGRGQLTGPRMEARRFAPAGAAPCGRLGSRELAEVVGPSETPVGRCHVGGTMRVALEVGINWVASNERVAVSWRQWGSLMEWRHEGFTWTTGWAAPIMGGQVGGLSRVAADGQRKIDGSDGRHQVDGFSGWLSSIGAAPGAAQEEWIQMGSTRWRWADSVAWRQ